MSERKWGSLAVDERWGLKTVSESYGRDGDDPAPAGHRFTIGIEGTVLALVAGDMGYESTHIVIPREHILALVEDWPEFKLAGGKSRIQELEAKLAKAVELVERAFNEGFIEGTNDVLRQSGGKSWYDSRSRKQLAELKGDKE